MLSGHIHFKGRQRGDVDNVCQWLEFSCPDLLHPIVLPTGIRLFSCQVWSTVATYHTHTK